MATGLVWNPWAVPGLAVGVFGVAAGLAIQGTGSTSRQARHVAALLVAAGIVWAAFAGVRLLLSSQTSAYALWVTATAFLLLSVPLVLGVAGTFPTRLGRPLRMRGAMLTAWIITVAVMITAILRPSDMAAGMIRSQPVRGWTANDVGVLWSLIVSLLLAAHVYGALCSITASRHARSDLHRRRLRVMGGGFLWYTVLQVSFPLVAVVALATGTIDHAWVQRWNFLASTLALAGLIATLAYGVLTAHLFDIDLKIKFAVKQSTVASVFAGVIFLGSEVIEWAFDVSGLVPTIVIAALAVLALKPLERIGQRAADALLPYVRSTPEYIDERKREVYLVALETAYLDRVITEKEREHLVGLRKRLGIPTKVAKGLERSILEAA